MAVRLGEALGLSASQRSDLYLMGLLHDVGKIGIDDDVLKKPDRLTREEYRQIQKHVEIGVQILNDLKKLHHVLPGVLHHHESYDGSGYPSGLAGEAIPLPARILAGLTEEERRWVTGLRMSAGVVATPQECVRAIRVLRLERERGDVQREIDRLQDTGGAASTARIMELWTRKKELLAQIESLA